MASGNKPSFSILQPKNSQDKVLVNTVISWVVKCLCDIEQSVAPATTAVESTSPSLKPSKYTVMVTQVQCFDPNCVPLETMVIIIGDGNTDKYTEKIQKPIADVSVENIENLEILGKIKQNFYSSQMIASIDDMLGKIYSSKDKIEFISSVSSYLALVNSKILPSSDDPIAENGDKNYAVTEVANAAVQLESKFDVPPPSTLVPMISKNNAIAQPYNSSNVTVVPMVSKSEVNRGSVETSQIMNEKIIISSGSSSSSSSSNSNSNSSNNSNNSNNNSNSNNSIDSSSSVYKAVSLGSSGAAPSAPVYSKATTFKSMQAAMQQEMGAVAGRGADQRKAHEKKSGCPCCDPDNVDTIIDKMMFFDA